MPKDRISLWGPPLARRILLDCIKLKKGETVAIEAWTRNVPWVDYFIIEARRVGAFPLVIYDSDKAFWYAYENHWFENLGALSPLERALWQNADAFVNLYGPADRTRLLTIPEEERKEFLAFEDEWFNIVKERKTRWVRVELTRATPKLAREYGVNYESWLKELFEASTMDPKELSTLGNRLVQKMQGGKVLTITHRNGTNLELRLKNRKYSIWDGTTEVEGMSGHGSTVPSGSVLTSVDEQFAEGKIISNQVIRFGTGRGVGTSAKWVFKSGHLEDYSYQKGVNEFESDLKRIGEEKIKPALFSIGLNPKIRKAPLFEIYERGTISFAIGSNEEVGGETKGEFHSWIVLRGASVSVDGSAIIRSGKIVN
jgi:leucyl aminopeptidase (aminopeptidase T)